MTHETRSRPEPVTPSRRDPIDEWLEVFLAASRLTAKERRAVRDELEDHLRSRVDDLLIAGCDEREAVRKAVEELGETVELARRFRAARGTPIRRSMMHATLFAVAGAVVAAAVGTFTTSPQLPPPAPVPAVGVALAEPLPASSSEAAQDLASVLVPIDTDGTVTMGELLERTAEANGLRLYVAWVSLNDIGIEETSTAGAAPTKGIALRRAFELFAPALGINPDLPMDAFVEGDLLYVASAKDVALRTKRVEKYDAGGVLAGNDPDDEMRELVKFIVKMVEPNGWIEFGGDEAQIQIAGTMLYLDAPARTHEQLGELLASLHDDRAAELALLAEADRLEREAVLEQQVALENRLEALRREYFELAASVRRSEVERGDQPVSSTEYARLELTARDLEAIREEMSLLERAMLELRYEPVRTSARRVTGVRRAPSDAARAIEARRKAAAARLERGDTPTEAPSAE